MVQSGISTAAAISAAAARSIATWGVWPASRRASAASLSRRSPLHPATASRKPASSVLPRTMGLTMGTSSPSFTQGQERGAQGSADDQKRASDQTVGEDAGSGGS